LVRVIFRQDGAAFFGNINTVLLRIVYTGHHITSGIILIHMNLSGGCADFPGRTFVIILLIINYAKLLKKDLGLDRLYILFRKVWQKSLARVDVFVCTLFRVISWTSMQLPGNPYCVEISRALRQLSLFLSQSLISSAQKIGRHIAPALGTPNQHFQTNTIHRCCAKSHSGVSAVACMM
jgi:hypothetical protein